MDCEADLKGILNSFFDLAKQLVDLINNLISIKIISFSNILIEISSLKSNKNLFLLLIKNFIFLFKDLIIHFITISEKLMSTDVRENLEKVLSSQIFHI